MACNLNTVARYIKKSYKSNLKYILITRPGFECVDMRLMTGYVSINMDDEVLIRAG